MQFQKLLFLGIIFLHINASAILAQPCPEDAKIPKPAFTIGEGDELQTVNGCDNNQFVFSSPANACAGVRLPVNNITSEFNSSTRFRWNITPALGAAFKITDILQGKYEVVFKEAGEYEVQLIAEDACVSGQSDSQLACIKVNVKLRPNITIKADTVCKGESFTATMLENGQPIDPEKIRNISWDIRPRDNQEVPAFTDGSPTINFDQLPAGTYFLSTSFESECGTFTSDTFPAFVNTPRPIHISSEPESGCPDTEIIITADRDNAHNYIWYENGVEIPGENSHILVRKHAEVGNYKYYVEAFRWECSIKSNTLDIKIGPPPQVGFTKKTTPENVCGPTTVAFTNTSVGANLTYQWDFGNGQTSTEKKPDPVTFQPGQLGDTVYLVKLQISNVCDSLEYIDSVMVKPNPVSKFQFENTNVCAGQPVVITNQSGGAPDTYIWDFGDGSPPQETTDPGGITHTFSNPGSEDTEFEVSLTASNACGTHSSTQTITVSTSTVEAFYNINVKTGCNPQEITLTSNQLEESGNEILWVWGDGDTTLGGISATHTYEVADTYYPQLIVSNGCNTASCGGIDDQECGEAIEILPVPTASFQADSTVCIGEAVTFQNTSTSQNRNIWDFGNGDTFVGADPPPYQYQTPGTYTVSLTVYGSNGCASPPMVQNITVRALPTAAFAIDDPQICATQPVSFVNASQGAISYMWEIEGQEQPVTQENFSTVFQNEGSYTITLTAYNDASQSGCAVQTEQTVEVYKLPQPDFTIYTNYDCGILEAEIVDNTAYPSPENGSFCWNFSGTENCNISQEDLMRQYENLEEESLFHTISLTVTDVNGCKNTYSDSLEIPSFSPNVKTPENNKAIAFTPDGSYNSMFTLPIEGDIGSFDMRIYQNWGNEVFRTTDPSQGWNGYYKGALAPAGMYQVVVNYTNCNQKAMPEKNVQLYLIRANE